MPQVEPPLSQQEHRVRALQLLPPSSALLLVADDWAGETESIVEPRPPSSDFYYLSGYEHGAAALLLLKPENSQAKPEQLIFTPAPSDFSTLWTGELAAPAQVARQLGFTQGREISELEEYLQQALVGLEYLYYELGKLSRLDEWLTSLLRNLAKQGQRRGLRAPTRLIASDEILANLRLVKSSAEMSLITKAAELSIGGHQRLQERLPQLKYEYQAAAELTYHYLKHNAKQAFPPIVAGGARSCVLHYTSNQAALEPTEHLLVDSGAMFEHYAADMTRCYPPAKPGENYANYKQIYQAVFRAHKHACAQVRPGITLQELHNQVVESLVGALLQLGIMHGTAAQIIQEQSYKKYFPHLTSHWIGLDVHDVGTYHGVQLQPGMVFSIEPGLYIAATEQAVAPAWRGLGVRLEDTLALTATGVLNLTAAMPYWTDDA